MKNAEERTQLIEDRKRRTESKYKLWIRDSWQDHDVWTVPVEALLINADNRRFRAEKMLVEEQLERPLDPENRPEDERSVESLLLDRSLEVRGDRVEGTESNDAVALKNDWLRRGQATPLWIRPDGTVRNGNRRLAMIKREQRRGGDGGLGYVDVVILTHDNVDEPALLEMEQREQLTENFKVRYADIDYLLALRDAAVHRDVDWFDRDSLDEVAGELQNMVEKSQGEVLRDLYAIKYMDLFLELSHQEGEYHKLLRTLEKFRDIGRTMMRVEAENPEEADTVLQVQFAAVRAQLPHQDIRAIRRILQGDRDRFDKLAEAVADLESDWEESGDPRLGSHDLLVSTQEHDDDDGESGGFGPELPSYPTQEVSTLIKVAIDDFESAQEEDALMVLKEVLNRLRALADGLLDAALAASDDTSSLREAIQQIVEWSEEHRALGDDSAT